MSATEQMRAMLDGLMGTARDGTDSQRKHLHFTDQKVCRAFLLDCCPHDIFAFTKLDIGECSKVHDPALRADYQNASKTKDYMYEVSALDRLQSFISDADRKTENIKQRLAETQEELTAEETNKLDSVHQLTEKLGKKLAELDKASAEDDEEAKRKIGDEIERIKKDRAQAEFEYKKVSRPASSHQQQNLRVCDICSAYLGINDNDTRLSDHYGGKLHLGFLTVREKLDELKNIVAEKRTKANLSINSNNNTSNSHIQKRSQHGRSSEKDRLNGREREHDYERSHREMYRGHDPHYHDRSTKEYDRYRDRDYDRYRDSRYGGNRTSYRDRDYHRDRDIERDRDHYRDRERSRSNSRFHYRDPPPQRDHSRSIREHRYRDDRVERPSRSWEERYDGRVQDREVLYQRRLREWEKREQEKSRRNVLRVEEDKIRKVREEQECRKLKEFLEDYNDDRDDMRYYRGSALDKRIAERRKEIEQDEFTTQRERDELEQLSRSCNLRPSDAQPISIVEDTTTVEQNTTEHTGNNHLENNSSTSSKESTANTTKATPVENKKEQVEKLIEKIPTLKEDLFAWSLDWSLLDDNLMEKRIRPWIAKKIAFFFDDMGEKENNLISWICKSLNSHADGNSILSQVALILEDDAEKFVVQMWRLLVFELEAKSRGLRK